MSRRRQAKYQENENGFKPRRLVPRTPGQEVYVEAVCQNAIVLCDGPAGTGKTHIAVGLAVKAKKIKATERIILSRPVVGVGTDLGYLPGPLEEKIGPYLVPLFDELSYHVNHDQIKTWMAEKVVEIVPLSMMRGRTFNDAFVILDEAQNATMAELRMLLTRLGQNSTMLLVGDASQSDLPPQSRGAFPEILRRLAGMDELGVVRLTVDDIVRHPMIAEIERRLGEERIDELQE
jgi:phosphate starvation-inducible PhoH-like protein